MKRAVALAALLVLAPAAAAAGTTLIVPLRVPKPPPVVGPFTAQLNLLQNAIIREQQTNPAAAQAATAAYTTALQQAAAGRYQAAQQSAREALIDAGQPPSGAGTVSRTEAAAAAQAATVAGSAPSHVYGSLNASGFYGADAPYIDADTFLAVARGRIADCRERHDPHLAAAEKSEARATRDFAAGNYEATRLDAKAAIDLCASPR